MITLALAIGMCVQTDSMYNRMNNIGFMGTVVQVNKERTVAEIKFQHDGKEYKKILPVGNLEPCERNN